MAWGILRWNIGGVCGAGEPIPLDYAKRWARALNKRYGAGTHWVERVDLEAEIDLAQTCGR